MQLWEVTLLPLYLVVIFWIARYIQQRNIYVHPEYKYYTYGLSAKLIGGLGYVYIYIFYYGSGDTTMYHDCAITLINLLLDSPTDFFKVFFSEATPENKSLFTNETGHIYSYMYYDVKTYTTIRFITPLLLFSFKSYLLTTLLIGWITYSGIWKVYSLFCKYYPLLNKQLAIAFLFIPSVVFWGSGIGKDSIMISAVGWFIYSFHKLFIVRKIDLWNISYLVIAGYLIMHIKSYALYALFPGLLLWIFHERITNITNQIIKILVISSVIISFFVCSYILFVFFGEDILKSEVLNDELARAAITQNDLKQEYYGGNSFDIGSFKPTPSGVISKIPIAIISGLFRPFLWEGNAMTFISALESSVIILLFVYVFIRTGFIKFSALLFNNPILLFFILYSIIFAFMVGLTTANFGALVRFKIPFLPFFVAALMILNQRKEFK